MWTYHLSDMWGPLGTPFTACCLSAFVSKIDHVAFKNKALRKRATWVRVLDTASPVMRRRRAAVKYDYREEIDVFIQNGTSLVCVQEVSANYEDTLRLLLPVRCTFDCKHVRVFRYS
jgi:hypothetical protein